MMVFSLSDIERRLKEWIEKNSDRISGGNILTELSHALISVMKDHLIITPNGTCIAPSQYVIKLNPSVQKNQKEIDDILSRMLRTIKQVALENEITFTQDPSIEIGFDPLVNSTSFQVDVVEKHGIEDTARMVLEVPPSLGKDHGTIPKKYVLKINDEEFYALTQMTINIGRHPDNQLVIPDPRVSRHHAQLRMTENHFVLSDLRSTGGTYINGEKITQQELIPGDIISLAGFPLIFIETLQSQTNVENGISE